MLKDDATFKGIVIQFENTILNKTKTHFIKPKIQNPK